MVSKGTGKGLVWGAVLGAAALAIVGFSWGDWWTNQQVTKHMMEVKTETTVALLVPACVAKAEADPEFRSKLAMVLDGSNYERRKKLLEIGWVPKQDSDPLTRAVADACAKELGELDAA